MKQTNRLMGVLLCTVFAMLYCNLSLAEMTKEARDSANSKLLELAQKQNAIKASRTTVEGKLVSCNLDYQFTYRDFNAKQGAVVAVFGQLANFYYKGKNASYAFKLVPSVWNIETQTFKVIEPAYVDIYLGKNSISKYKKTEFACENNGKCQAYEDPKLDLTGMLLDESIDNFTVKFSLNKGGYDTEFNLLELSDKEQSKQERAKYSECMVEILSQIRSDIQNSIKSK